MIQAACDQSPEDENLVAPIDLDAVDLSRTDICMSTLIGVYLSQLDLGEFDLDLRTNPDNKPLPSTESS